MGSAGGHAVVVGASIGGLLAARALAGPYDRVTILDRDTLPTGPDNRKGVPQGRHVHALLARAAELLDAMFPGFLDELEGAGVPVVRDWAQTSFAVGNHSFALPEGAASVPLYSVSRPELEFRVRARVRALRGVEILDGAEVRGLLATPGGDRVTGVRVHREGVETEVAADLVVDATGRTGRAPVWLAELGYEAAPEEELPIDLMYATRHGSGDDCEVDGVIAGLIGHYPGMPRGFFAQRLEGGRGLVTAAGFGPAHHPPSDVPGFDAFVAGVAPPRVAAAITAADSLGPVITHRFPSNIRRRYERLDRFPDGFLVFGDAICSLNPLYGTGMTVCALEAEALRRCLLAHGDETLGPRFFKAAAKPVDVAWQLCTGADLALPEIEGERSAQIKILNRFITRLQAAAETEPLVSVAFLRVVHFLDPPTRLFAPSIVRRVFRPAAAAPAGPSVAAAAGSRAPLVGADHT
jgi:2-polyprenyl-6-methoxyphenol hydroxylase-like FAD-dependent oxidoreductase